MPATVPEDDAEEVSVSKLDDSNAFGSGYFHHYQSKWLRFDVPRTLLNRRKMLPLLKKKKKKNLKSRSNSMQKS